MAVEIDGKTYRNLPEQVEENANNIEQLKAILASTGNIMLYKGSVDTYADLPTEDNKVGDVYNVIDTGNNYAWDGEGWDEIGSTVDLSGYVDKASAQTITGKKTFTDTIEIKGASKQLEVYGSGIMPTYVGDGIVSKGGGSGNLIVHLGFDGRITVGTGAKGVKLPSNINTWTEDGYIVDTAHENTITGAKTILDAEFAFSKTGADGSAKWTLEEDVYAQLLVSRYYNGTKTTYWKFNGMNLLPNSTGANSIGNSSLFLNTVYANNINGSSNIIVKTGTGNRFIIDSTHIQPIGDKDLGDSSNKFRHLYLSGNISDGTNTVTVAQIAAASALYHHSIMLNQTGKYILINVISSYATAYNSTSILNLASRGGIVAGGHLGSSVTVTYVTFDNVNSKIIINKNDGTQSQEAIIDWTVTDTVTSA